MIKLVFCCRRKPEMSLEEFQTRWRDVHGPLVRKLRERLPMMKRYVQSHSLAPALNAPLQASRGTAEPYDGITEVWFESLEAMAAQGDDALEAARQLHEDEAEFLDFARSSVFLTEEIEIF